MTFDRMRSLLSCATSSVLWTVLVLVHLCLAEETKEHFPKQFDFRIISYEDLVKNAWQFQHPDLANFTKLTIDASNDQLLVGSRDSLFRLSLDNLSLKEYVEDDAADPQLCRDKGLAEKCHNYIQVLQLLNYTKTRPDSDVDHAVFICGTNALSPVCTWRPANNLSRVLESTKGLGKTSYDPLQNSTTLVTSEGDIYGATYNGVGERDPVIYRTESTTSRDLRTAQANSKWLNEPDFISSYEIGDLVYFFFREVAVEFINCGKKTYSRVARICKTDQGGMFESTWTTFFKSRLNCSLPGEYPFYYEELQGTFLLEYGEEHERQKYIFAVFNTPMNSIAGSAVCMYSMKSFNESFSGPFKHQESPRSAWERHEQPDNGVKPLTQCQEKRDHSKRSNNLNMDDSKYQLMDNAVQPVTLMPYVHADNERWTHVVVDYVTGQHDNKYTVVFVATEDGKLLKMAKVPGVEETCLIEEIKIVPNGHRKPVKDIKIASKELAIYISTHNSVIKIPVHRCGRFTTEDLCLNAKDPYCGWDVDKHQCITLPVNRTSIYWRQEIDGCPVITRDINGDWSEWSSWGKCQQVGGDAAAGPCLCRSRSCDNPKPFGDGLECYGASMEVTNCTVHGQWTEWSSWSQCTQSCGSSATRMRYRYCSNPPPRNGGNDCLNKNSKNSEEEYCQGNQPCPLPPIKSNWTEWAEWSECSAKCNGGIQTRRRSCVEPPGPVNKVPCTGNTQEWRMCNTQICEELHQMTPWTPWIPTNQTRGGYFENRFRFMCKATVPSQSLIKTKGLKTQTRFCVDGGQCHTSGELKSELDTHSPVDRVIRRYCKHRRRIFRGYCKCRTLGIFLVCHKCGYG